MPGFPGTDSEASNTNRPSDLQVTAHPNGTVKLESLEGNYLECRAESLVSAAIFASIGDITSNHPIYKWQPFAAADATISEQVDSSDSASSITASVSGGRLSLAGNGASAQTLSFDLKLGLTLIIRIVHQVLRNVDDAVGLAWSVLHGQLKGSGYFEL